MITLKALISFTSPSINVQLGQTFTVKSKAAAKDLVDAGYAEQVQGGGEGKGGNAPAAPVKPTAPVETETPEQTEPAEPAQDSPKGDTEAKVDADPSSEKEEPTEPSATPEQGDNKTNTKKGK